MAVEDDVERFVEIMGKGDVHFACWKAARAGNCQLIDRLCTLGANIKWKNPEYNEYTALHVACQKGHDEAVRLLVQQGADVNATGVALETPLHEAMHEKHQLTALFLILNGARMDVKTKYHKQPLDFAKQNRFFTAVENALRDHQDKDQEICSLKRLISKQVISSCCDKLSIKRNREEYNNEKKLRLQCESENIQLKAMLLETKSELLETSKNLENVMNQVALSEKEYIEQCDILKDQIRMADSRRRRHERRVADAEIEITSLEEQLKATRAKLEESYEENKQHEHFISTSVSSVVKKNEVKYKNNNSPRTVKLRTLTERVQDAEDRAFEALESKEEAEKQIQSTAAYINQIEDELQHLRSWKEEEDRKNNSAIKIQANFRGRMTRRKIEMSNKATLIQKKYRGHRVRRMQHQKCQTLQRPKLQTEENEANGVLESKHKIENTVDEDSTAERISQWNKDEEEAARVIQVQYKRRIVRRRKPPNGPPKGRPPPKVQTL